MNITHTISLLELIWTISGLIGLLYMALLFYRSWKDREWLVTTRANGDFLLRKHVAMTSILIFTGGLCTQSSYLAVGIIAMTQGGSHSHPTTAQIISSSIFIAASLVGTFFAGLIYQRRTGVVKEIIQNYGRREYDH